jgi:ribonuclease P protein component
MAGKGSPPETGAESRADLGALKLVTIKSRADFLRARDGRRHGLLSLAVEACRSPEGMVEPGVARVGFTASRRVGGAVQRNRAKRRLRALAQRVVTVLGREGHDYVLIARARTLTRGFTELENDLGAAISALHAAFDRHNRERSG